MALYCELRVVHETKVSNDLQELLEVLEPYREELEGVAVESTFNRYWLVQSQTDISTNESPAARMGR